MRVISQYTSAVTTVRASEARKLWDNLGYDEASVEAFNVLRHSKPPVSKPDPTRSGYRMHSAKIREDIQSSSTQMIKPLNCF